MESQARTRRLTAVRREEERVTALELFFDLVFVLALTQCTALMAATPTWDGIVQALLVLGLLWWSWGGYAWLTSVVDPEEGAVRIAIFAAMAAFLVAALAVPGAFDDEAEELTGALPPYGFPIDSQGAAEKTPAEPRADCRGDRALRPRGEEAKRNHREEQEDPPDQPSAIEGAVQHAPAEEPPGEHE